MNVSLIILIDILMIFFGTSTLKFLSSITDTGYRVETYGIYVLKDSKIKDLDDVKYKSISYLDMMDDTNVLKVIDKLDKNDYVATLSLSNNFYKIVYEGSSVGYVHKSYLVDTYTYSSKSLNVVSYKQTDSRWSSLKIGKSSYTVGKADIYFYHFEYDTSFGRGRIFLHSNGKPHADGGAPGCAPQRSQASCSRSGLPDW